MAGVTTRISSAATRPFTSMRFNRFCATTPFSASDKRVANLVLLTGREDVDHAIDGLCGAWSVQRSEYEMSRGRRRQCQFDGFEVAHFTDENDVGIFTQRAAQRRGKRFRVQADFAMIDQAALALVHEFDRIFDRDDVILPDLVRVVDDRRQRRGFSASRRSGDEHQSLVELRELLHDRRQAQLFRRQDLRGNLTEDRGARRISD